MEFTHRSNSNLERIKKTSAFISYRDANPRGAKSYLPESPAESGKNPSFETSALVSIAFHPRLAVDLPICDIVALYILLYITRPRVITFFRRRKARRANRTKRERAGKRTLDSTCRASPKRTRVLEREIEVFIIAENVRVFRHSSRESSSR